MFITSETSSHTDTDCGNSSDIAPSERSGSPKDTSPDFSEDRQKQKQCPLNVQHVTPPRADKDQVFHEAPPAEGYPGGANSSSVTDWSRGGRIKKLLIKAASDIKQTFITQYYDIVDEIEVESH